MSPEDDLTKQPRRRGRPPKKQQQEQTAVEQQQEKTENVQDTVSQEQVDADERLVSTIEEEKLSTFSSFLRHLLRYDRGEIARLARELDVAENTIYRWMNGTSEPRPIYLKKLVDVLPEQRSNLTYAINQTFPGALDSLTPGPREVQKDIYRRVMELVATVAEPEARRWHITQTIFEYALLHLDSDRRGLAITYAKLMPPRADGIHSLCEVSMRGNYPWPFALEHHTYLGSTTLAGTAAMLARLQTWENLSHEERLQVEVDEFERSACAYPVTFAGRISGVLVTSSTQSGFFGNPVASQAVVEYAQLLALAFHEEEFYPFALLNLRPMPELKWQRAEISRSYVNRIMAYARKHGVSRQEAELHVRSDMELEFEEIGRFHHERRQRLISPDSQSQEEKSRRQL